MKPLFKVFEAGCLEQFDSPQNLLLNNSGHFHEMINNMSEVEQMTLASMIGNKEVVQNFEKEDIHNEDKISNKDKEQKMNGNRYAYSNIGFESDTSKED